jgi:hypothetical protein
MGKFCEQELSFFSAVISFIFSAVIFFICFQLSFFSFVFSCHFFQFFQLSFFSFFSAVDFCLAAITADSSTHRRKTFLRCTSACCPTRASTSIQVGRFN